MKPPKYLLLTLIILLAFVHFDDFRKSGHRYASRPKPPFIAGTFAGDDHEWVKDHVARNPFDIKHLGQREVESGAAIRCSEGEAPANG